MVTVHVAVVSRHKYALRRIFCETTSQWVAESRLDKQNVQARSCEGIRKVQVRATAQAEQEIPYLEGSSLKRLVTHHISGLLRSRTRCAWFLVAASLQKVPGRVSHRSYARARECAKAIGVLWKWWELS